jgi:hypothetical protein
MEESKKFLEYRERSEENMRGGEGKVLRVNRSIQGEGERGPPFQRVSHLEKGWGTGGTMVVMFWIQNK